MPHEPLGMTVNRVGVIGLGSMGRGIIMSLRRGGFRVLGHDDSAQARDTLQDEGVAVTRTLAGAASTAGLLILALPNSAAVEQLVFGPDGLLLNGPAGLIVLDTTPTAPHSARKVAGALEAMGIHYLDGAASGGPQAAITGTLDLLLGGEQAHIDTIAPVLAAISTRRVHAGPAGAGHAARLLRQLVVGTELLIADEAARIAAALGLDPRLTLHRARQLYDGVTDARHLQSDLNLAMHLIDASSAAAPLGRAAGRLWAAAGGGPPDAMN
ncbi:NAD(P)-binding domain-containing protein [Janthinobacterium sp. hw3]|uniref:NAD(P)-binding domain-containing protein n=2 Tax=Janthinobacterium fluminis TaxID=2987524 RepID=A0ABT5K0K9_9BURK|nr:NAD(P)-binding domain-containing protein [Janthinobacterium fluminis]MDC8757948.1 NAD(P)-binding domain-containing protein [Janthinobacterium fluminis]